MNTLIVIITLFSIKMKPTPASLSYSILSTAFVACCLGAYLSLVRAAGFSARCLLAHHRGLGRDRWGGN